MHPAAISGLGIDGEHAVGTNEGAGGVMAFGKRVVLVAIVPERIAPDHVRQALGGVGIIKRARAKHPQKQAEIFQVTGPSLSPFFLLE